MRANEFINEGFADAARGLGNTLKSAGGSAASGIGNALSGISKSVKDSDNDWLKGQLHRFGGGMFGQQGNMAATKTNFIKNFVQEYNQILKSAKSSGLEFPTMEEYVSDYIDQAGWNVNPAQVQQVVSTSGDNIQAVANGVYAIGMMNRNSRGKKTDMGASDADSDEGQLSVQGQKISAQVGAMRNPRDLTATAKAAMNQLNAVNKQAYAELRKEVQTGENI